jgi:hypothetical protein
VLVLRVVEKGQLVTVPVPSRLSHSKRFNRTQALNLRQIRYSKHLGICPSSNFSAVRCIGAADGFRVSSCDDKACASKSASGCRT